MIKTRLALGFLLVVWSGSNMRAMECGSETAPNTEGLEGAITSRMKTIEQAWNRGDASSYFSEYDPSMVGILESDFVNYGQYRNTVKSMISEAARPTMKLVINLVRPLGARYALVNGRVHMMERGGSDQVSPFTVIYRCSGSQWMIVYAHS